MNRSQRTERERPFKFTIEVEAVVGGWVASVDTDDGDEREFKAVGDAVAKLLRKPGTISVTVAKISQKAYVKATRAGE